MSRPTWNIDQGPLQGFYRDRENAWIFGVCAGLADRFNLRTGMVRLLAVVSLACFFWLTGAAYLAITLMVREKPLVYSGRQTEFEFWRRNRGDTWGQP